jgi:ankyrin repeat protein
LCIIAGNATIVEYLIKKGADINLKDYEMHSVIHWSVVCSQHHLIDFLLENKADPETPDIHGAYPIHYAAQMCGQVDILNDSFTKDTSKSYF